MKKASDHLLSLRVKDLKSLLSMPLSTTRDGN
jgi:hypothetical protein